ncbi:DsbA family oxidoreductase [Flaviflexus massiliensis]|uniref:DsbA family oxidoreductase n=1 Tax=Flaviflexus massiliensis TaxID=1522309 RepID=UPI00097D467E|nr:DsbA family protein [Flaviflexus massiliensis]
MSTRLAIHVWTDLSSPTSFLGLQNLLDGTRGKNVAIEHHAFFGGEADGSWRDTERQSLGALQEAALVVSEMEHGDTRAAQELIYAAKERGATPEESAALGVEMAMRIHEAAHLHGRNIADIDILVELAEESGLDGAAVQAGLSSGQWSAFVDSDVKDAGRLELARAPFLFLSGIYLVEGVQSPEVIAKLVSSALGEVNEREQAAAGEARDLFGWQG